MESVPKDVYVEILLKLPLGDVLNFCLTAKRYNVMNNENFWRRKMVKDGYKDLFSKYIPSQKERYKLDHSDRCLIIREVNSYFTDSLGNFSRYIDVEAYKKDFIKAVYDLREGIVKKRITRNEYGSYELPKTFYDFFPSCHWEGFDDFDQYFIFESLIYPLLHSELRDSDSENEEYNEQIYKQKRVEIIQGDLPELQVVRVEPGFYRDIERGFIVTQFLNGTVCVLKIEENGIWRELNENERMICASLGLIVRMPHEKDKEIEDVTILPDELSIQYIYFDDITITLNHHFVIYKDTVAFKIAEGTIWRPLTPQEKKIAISYGLQVL